MQDVIISVDPAKRSHTIEVLDQRERTLATLRIENTTAGYRELRAFVKKWPSRRWAIEGAQGVGRQLAQRLIADGERVIDVPAKLSTRVRVLDTGHGRKKRPSRCARGRRRRVAASGPGRDDPRRRDGRSAVTGGSPS